MTYAISGDNTMPSPKKKPSKILKPHRKEGAKKKIPGWGMPPPTLEPPPIPGIQATYLLYGKVHGGLFEIGNTVT